MSITIEPVTDTELRYVEDVLRDAGLPTAGLRDEAVRLYVALNQAERVGVGGFERYGETGLLRSIAVEPSVRGNGFGGALVAAIEAEASTAGIRRLVLLTTDAEPFFKTLGYTPADWAAQPSVIRETSALVAVCPDSAACLEKRL